MQQIIGGKKYDTETAVLVASDLSLVGHNRERHGRNTWLYKTKNGAFFLHHTTIWKGERGYIEAIDVDAAKAAYERLLEHELTYEGAFGVAPVEA